jgi:DNA repair protein RecO (recombination protein O)
MRIALQPAFVLHHRPYRETSVLLDLFTQEHGRMTAVAKGVRQSRSRTRSLLQPFVPILVSWQGKGELATLHTVESNGYPTRVVGDCLLSGLYLNELLMRVLHKHDPHPELYTIYQNTLLELQSADLQQKTLRLFEMKLLDELGYGLQLQHDASSQDSFSEDLYYRFHPEYGFERCQEGEPLTVMVFSGKSLLQLAAEDLNDEESLRDAKRLMRIVMAPILGQYQLRSRQLFMRKDKEEAKVE